MNASEIRRRFLEYFRRNGHAVRPSSSLVPQDDPTLLFVNAGMVQFKKVFLGLEQPTFGRRATTSQKCVRAGGKHNDLEQVGHTARHHTFFEMLGNFSFGDYFKRDAIRFAWEFVTVDLGISPDLLRVTVHDSDEEARALWREIAGLPDSRIYSLGDKDNFWQMADTGPCGPCSELYVDLARVASDWAFPPGASGEWTETNLGEYSLEAFVEGAEAGRFLEIWNLVFMQFDRQADGTLVPLPKPSVDTGAGLERIAVVLQGVTNNYHTDLFKPLLESVERVVGVPYRGRQTQEAYPYRLPDAAAGSALSSAVRDGMITVDPASFRVLADHARAVAFLLADGVFPSNDGRGYTLRRILRRAVRHAWLLGRVSPTLVEVVETVIGTMGDAYPELLAKRQHIIETTRAEELRFLATIEGGLTRFEQIAPLHSTQGSTALRGTISGEDAFRLYDTFGFPIDLTDLMARERGYTVDMDGFERALEAQRSQSRAERRTRKLGVGADAHADWTWEEETSAGEEQAFVGYDTVEIETQVAAVSRLPDGRMAIALRETPFYAESGGQISDTGEIAGDGWRVDVEEVRRIDGRIVAVGPVEGTFSWSRATARVPSNRRRDTERNHTATHLLHAALRHALGEHVHQAGSMVSPDRLRFDFTHHGPISPEVLESIEVWVNRAIWDDVDVHVIERPYADAVASGAMALFGEKYGDRVRVVDIPGYSVELCGGTHARNTGQIALFRIMSESGVAAGVRRIEAVTGPVAYDMILERESKLSRIAELVKSPVSAAPQRVEALLEERRALQKRLDEAMRGGGDQVQQLVAGAQTSNGARIVAAPVTAADTKELQSIGDALRERLGSGVGVIAASFPEGKHALLVVVTDDLRERGVRADNIVREIAAVAGGKGGGKPHMAQAGIPDGSRIADALAGAADMIRPHLVSP